MALAIHLSLTLILLTLHNYCFTAYAVSTLNITWSDFLELCHCIKWIFQQSVKSGLWFSNFNLTFQKIFQCYVLITELLYRTAKRKKRKKFKDNWLTWSKNFKIIEVLWFSLKYWLSIRKIVTNSYLVSCSLVLGSFESDLCPGKNYISYMVNFVISRKFSLSW